MNKIKVKTECEIIVSPEMLQTLIKVGIAQNRDWIINSNQQLNCCDL